MAALALLIAIPLGAIALAVWALRHQRRMVPPQTRIAGDPDRRNRDLRWIGFIYGGGRG
jgi:hypothetical protein